MNAANGRPPTALLVWNIVALNVGWFACVLPAIWGLPWVGPLCIAALVAIHLYLVEARQREVAVIAAVGAFGYFADSTATVLGVFAFPEQAILGGPSPLWMVALWCNFATAPSLALYWLAKRPLLAATCGLIGGPMAYFGGMQLGGMMAPAGTGTMLAVVAVEWAIATPLILWVSVHLGRLTRQPVPAEA